jgi:hypothetical protein
MLLDHPAIRDLQLEIEEHRAAIDRLYERKRKILADLMYSPHKVERSSTNGKEGKRSRW